MIPEISELAEDLDSAGFKEPAEKRGIVKWIMGIQFGLIISLTSALIIQSNRQSKIDEKHNEGLEEIIKMQMHTKNRIDSTLNKL